MKPKTDRPSHMVLTYLEGSKMTTYDKSIVRANLRAIFELLDDLRLQMGKVEFYSMIAEKLNTIANREKPWTWRYVQKIHAGTIEPSTAIANAIMALGMQIDGSHAETIGTEEVSIFARPGKVIPGSLVLGESKICKRPGSTTRFVPNVPWRKYCGVCPQCREAK